jgi:hypothetical protein
MEAARIHYIDEDSKRDSAAERYSTRANCSEQAATRVDSSTQFLLISCSLTNVVAKKLLLTFRSSSM